MLNYRSAQYETQNLKKQKTRWEFLILFLLLFFAVGTFFTVAPGLSSDKQTAPKANSIAWMFPPEHRKSFESFVASIPNPFVPQGIPANYEVKGEVGDQYQVAIDPKTGEMIIHDNLGGVGTNTTSVEGNRRYLTEGMLEVDTYADQNCHQLSSIDCFWLNDVAKKGVSLAFGAPGRPIGAQSTIKQQKLQEFYESSVNAPVSFTTNDKYLEIQEYLAGPQELYLSINNELTGLSSQEPRPLAPASGDLLSFDPVYTLEKPYEPYLVQSQPTYDFLGTSGLYYPSDPYVTTTLSPTYTLAGSTSPYPTTSTSISSPTTLSLTGSTSTTTTSTTSSTATFSDLLACTIGDGTCNVPTTSTTTTDPTYTTLNSTTTTYTAPLTTTTLSPTTSTTFSDPLITDPLIKEPLQLLDPVQEPVMN